MFYVAFQIAEARGINNQKRNVKNERFALGVI